MGVNRREQVQREASPVHLFKKLSHTATVVILETEAIANESFKVMLAPIPMNNLIDVNDVRDCLQLVADKLDARKEKKRKADDEARARQEVADTAAGEARRATKAEIFGRPVNGSVEMDNVLRRI